MHETQKISGLGQVEPIYSPIEEILAMPLFFSRASYQVQVRFRLALSTAVNFISPILHTLFS